MPPVPNSTECVPLQNLCRLEQCRETHESTVHSALKEGRKAAVMGGEVLQCVSESCSPNTFSLGRYRWLTCVLRCVTNRPVAGQHSVSRALARERLCSIEVVLEDSGLPMTRSRVHSHTTW